MNKKIIIIIAVVVLVLIIAAVAVWFFVLRPTGDEESTAPIVYFEFPLGEMYTNIKTEGSDSNKTILKCNPVIQYTDEKFVETLTTKKTIIITEMRKYFMNRTDEQLQRLDRVQEDLADLVREELEATPDVVSNVLFLEFITQ